MRSRSKNLSESKAGAYDFAVRKLCYKMRTEKELRELMREAGYADGETDETVESLKELHYIDDLYYAGRFYEYSREKLRSYNRIVRELSIKGIDGETAAKGIDSYIENEGLPDVAESELETAGKAGMKLAEAALSSRKPRDERMIASIARKLAALGYGQSTSNAVLADVRRYIRMHEEETSDEL